MPRSGKAFWFLLLTPTLLGFDWGTKALANRMPEGGEILLVPGWLSLYHAENPDIAFSIQVPMAMILVAGFAMLAGLMWTWWQLPGDARVRSAAIGILVAGALGNLVDRLVDGSVTDMVRIYTEHPTLMPWLVERFGTATWPIFNVADVCILGGVSLWVGGDFFQRDEASALSVPDLDEAP